MHHPNLARMLPLPGGAGLAPIANGASRLVEFSDPDFAFPRIEPERLIWALIDVLSGLRALHEAELDGGPFVHGSITPQYILLGEPGSARLVPVTSAHLMPNVPRKPTGYVAPELLRGEPADQRADVFSIGVLLWEALAGRRLFPDPSRGAVLGRLERGDTPRLADLVKASWALPLCRVAERAIATTPAARFGSALELSSAIVLAAGCHLTSPPEASRRASLASTPSAPPIGVDASPGPIRWRNMTPPATVIDLPPAPGLGDLDSVTRLAPPALPLTGSNLDWSDEQPPSQPLQRVARVPRQAAWVAAAALGMGCLLLAAHKSPVVRQPMAAALTAPEPGPAAKVVEALPSASASATLAARLAAPAASVTPSVERKLEAQNPIIRRRSRPRPRSDSDYGI